MDEFISQVTQSLGIGESESRTATGGVLKTLKEQLGDSAFGGLLEKIPGADTLVAEAESGQSTGGGGLMGSLTSMAGNLLGGKDSAAAGITKAFGDAGIGLDKIPDFLSMLQNFLKEKMGDDMYSSIMAKLPEMFGNQK